MKSKCYDDRGPTPTLFITVMGSCKLFQQKREISSSIMASNDIKIEQGVMINARSMKLATYRALPPNGERPRALVVVAHGYASYAKLVSCCTLEFTYLK